MLTFVYLYR